MAEKVIMEGNTAAVWGAIAADCQVYVSYPVTPQSEIVEWCAREFPQRGKIFLQSPSEIGSTFMVMGAAAAGARVMTSTSGPGWGLYPEGWSHLVNAELPAVLVLVQRGGPGQGTTRHSQMDYTSATRGGGQGGYKNIVLAPVSAQEIHDFVQLAFYIADKYRNPVIVLTEAIITRLLEVVEKRILDFPPLPEKDWVLRGKAHHKDGKPRLGTSAHGFTSTPEYPTYLAFLQHLDSKYRQMKDAEVRYETYQLEDATLVLVAYGYTARVSLEAIYQARAQGIKAGLMRPITLWPFPTQILKKKAEEGVKFLVIEDSAGQIGGIIDDVRLAVEGKAQIEIVTALERHDPGEGGAIFPERVLERIKELQGTTG